MQKSIYPGASGASIISQSEVDASVKFGRSQQPELPAEKRGVTRVSPQLPIEKRGLTRFYERKQLTDCLEILAQTGIQGDEAIFILSNLGGEA